MNYKPDEKDWMAYLYGEMEGDEKERFEQFLMNDEEARRRMKEFRQTRTLLGALDDKEVIAPPMFFSEPGRRFWDYPYFRTIMAIAASLLLLIVAGKLTGLQLSVKDNEFRIGFGERPSQTPANALSPEQVQQMINQSLLTNQQALQTSWDENQRKLENSIKQSLASNNERMNGLVQQAALASQDQVKAYVSTLQTENVQMVKDYFQLTSTEQKRYVENLLVDFSKYLQQQRMSDLQLVESKLQSIEKNTDVFKQETEQILTSIITSVNTGSTDKGIRN